MATYWGEQSMHEVLEGTRKTSFGVGRQPRRVERDLASAAASGASRGATCMMYILYRKAEPWPIRK